MDLEVSQIEIVGQGGASFTLLEEPGAFVLPTGSERTIDVLFAPAGADELVAQAIVHSDDELSPLVPVNLLGEGSVAELQISPDPYDFGDTYVGCGKEADLTLSNVGTLPLEVTGIAHSGEPFSLGVLPALPLSLAPGESATLGIAYTPEIDGLGTGVLTVESTEPLGERSADQTGTGAYGSEVEQVWEHAIDPPSDIFFAVDHSCSMSDDAMALASNFGTFIGELSNYSNDWQIMVGYGNEGCNLGGILTPSVADYMTTFQAAVQCDWATFFGECVFGDDDFTEALLTTAAVGIENTGSGQCNDGFLREGALLHIVLVSDEPEQSTESWQALADRIIAAKGSIGQVRISAIAGDYPGGCSSFGNSADAGTGYWEATNYTNGVFLSICSTWSDPSSMQLLAEASVLLDTYPLDQRPVESSIRVFVNDAEVFSVWHYDDALQSVVFDLSSPGEGSEVRVTYAPYVDCD
jgi:hypothetical protein